MGGFVPEASPPPPSATSDISEDDDDTSEDDDGGDASSFGTDEMSTWHSNPLSFVTKSESSFGYESSHS